MTIDPRSLGTDTPDDFCRIREVFEAALERPAGERLAFVERACHGNTLLVAEVERMLSAEGQHDGLLDGGPVDGNAPGVATRHDTCASCHAALLTRIGSDVRAVHPRAPAAPTKAAFAPARSSPTASARSRGSGAAGWAMSTVPTISSSASRSR
jgi:hypothetical protein